MPAKRNNIKRAPKVQPPPEVPQNIPPEPDHLFDVTPALQQKFSFGLQKIEAARQELNEQIHSAGLALGADAGSQFVLTGDLKFIGVYGPEKVALMNQPPPPPVAE